MGETAHKIADLLRAVAGSPNPKNQTTVIIAAAGNSVRMGGEIPKLFMDLCGLPVGLHTLLAYQNASCIQEIVLVTKKEYFPVYEEWKNKYGIDKMTKIAVGGETRTDSVRAGLEVIHKSTKFVAVADGARCLTTPEEINRVCHAAYQHGCAVAAVQTHDTVKIGDKNAFISETPDRKTVWLAQTPQVFRTAIYRAASYVAQDENIQATDDSQLAEHIGNPVKLVTCSDENRKITTAFDLICAKEVLKARLDPASPSYRPEIAAYLQSAMAKSLSEIPQSDTEDAKA